MRTSPPSWITAMHLGKMAETKMAGDHRRLNSESAESGNASLKNDKWHYLKGGVFLASVTGASIVFGFGMTLAMAKKRDPNLFTKGLMGSKDIPESGGSLALRALGRGTLYSITGFGAFCFLVWKAMGVNNLTEFREKMQRIMPKIPKNEPQGRTEFKNLRELLQYVIDESDKDKGKKS